MPTQALEELIGKLTPVQREAVLHVAGPLLVLAGPGSGKTRVITCRIAHLIAQGVRPSQILAITFTNKAAGEMKSRVEALMPRTNAWISTFHSMGVKLLRQYADRLDLDRNFTIYDQSDRVRMVKMALEAAGFDNNRFTPETIQARISKAKNDLLLPEPFARQAGNGDYFSQVVANVYAIYEKKMREANAFDFDDLLMWPALALKNNNELRAELDARFQYVLIDEYQDTNKAQYSIARSLSVDHPNLCVVGDPDQSIYKWRGSDIRNILDFERDFPSARVITLAENFRSTKAVLRVADALIAHNRQRKARTLITANAEGTKPKSLLFENGLEEADQVVSLIKKAVESGKRKYRDFALLLRMNALTRVLETAFVRQRVPFQIVRGLAFFDRKENKDIVAYLRLLLNPRDDISFLRVVNEPARGIGKTSLDHLRAYAEPREMCLLSAASQVDKIPAIKGKAASGLRSFVEMMEEFRWLADAAPDEGIRQILTKSGYEKMLVQSDDPDDAERLANVQELISAARQSHLEDNTRSLADFLENITLAGDVDGWDETQDMVSIMTLHAAKGLEFPVVYMLAMEQGVLPHERSMAKDEEIEEERRLAFVGMTRAKDELYLSHCRMRDFRGQTLYAVPSMFLEELSPSDIEEVDMSHSAAGVKKSPDQWRGSTLSASHGWYDTGFRDKNPKPPSKPTSPALAALSTTTSSATAESYAQGVLVMHDTYGVGRIIEVSGQGALRKIKITFKTGDRTFLAEKAKLSIVQKK